MYDMDRKADVRRMSRNYQKIVFFQNLKISIDLELTLRCKIIKEKIQRGDSLTIKEVAQQFHLTKDTLRYYEKVGLIGPIQKNVSGIRDYQEEDIKRIAFVKCMRSADIPIDSLVTYMHLYDEGPGTETERKILLEKQRDILKSRIDELQTAYEKLNYKIDLYTKQEDLTKPKEEKNET